MDAMRDHIPMALIAQPEDHTGLYVLLASRTDSAYVTGAMFLSDGGLTLGYLRHLAAGRVVVGQVKSAQVRGEQRATTHAMTPSCGGTARETGVGHEKPPLPGSSGSC